MWVSKSLLLQGNVGEEAGEARTMRSCGLGEHHMLKRGFRFPLLSRAKEDPEKSNSDFSVLGFHLWATWSTLPSLAKPHFLLLLS